MGEGTPPPLVSMSKKIALLKAMSVVPGSLFARAKNPSARQPWRTLALLLCVVQVNTKHALSGSVCSFKMRAVVRWIFIFIVAVVTALVAVAITVAARRLTRVKFDTVNSLIQDERNGKLSHGIAFTVYLAFVLVFAAIASSFVTFLEPMAQGSGISEIKCILNGVRIPRATRLKTIAAKVASIVFAVASGLPVGKEGPMIHSGAGVAAGVSQGKSKVCGMRTPWLKFPAFRNDKEKRDFITSGSAAGVAAAFGAPIGGVMFALEEGASFWSQSLTWRSFFCAVVSTYVLDLFLSAPGVAPGGIWGKLNQRGLFSFGGFTADQVDPWVAWELPVFVAMGCLGGAYGALFNWVNKLITVARMKYVHPFRHMRMLEVLAIATLVAGVSFGVPIAMGRCVPVPAASKTKEYEEDLAQFYCPDGHYNPVATYFFAPAESAIKQLFHFDQDSDFDMVPLVAFFFLYTALTCITYGSSVASGLFIPCLLGGSALGRFVGQLINHVAGRAVVDAGTYSLIGAASVLGGMARLTISLAVVLIEATGDLQYGLPLMLTLMAARFMGNVFNEGLYDIHIHLKRWPLLEEKLPKRLAHRLMVADVMAAPVVVLRDVETVEQVLAVLRGTTHHAFPVVFAQDVMAAHPRLGSVAGIIQRKHLSVLLARRAYFFNAPPAYTAADSDGVHPPALSPVKRRGDGDGKSRPSAMPHKLKAAASTGQLSTMQVPARPLQRKAPVAASTAAAAPAGSDEASPTADVLRDEDVAPGGAASMLPKQASDHSLYGVPVTQRLGVQGREGSSASLNGADHFMANGALLHSVALNRIAHSVSTQDWGTSTAPPSQGGRQVHSLHTLQQMVSVPDSERLDLFAAPAKGYTGAPLLSWSDFEEHYPRYPSLRALRAVPREHYGCFVDLRPYMNPTPHTVHACAPITRAFHLLRGLGLRHLMVVNDYRDVVGMVTRSDLAAWSVEAAVQRKEAGVSPARAATGQQGDEPEELTSDDSD